MIRSDTLPGHEIHLHTSSHFIKCDICDSEEITYLVTSYYDLLMPSEPRYLCVHCIESIQMENKL